MSYKKREASGRYWLVRGNESKRTNSARARSALWVPQLVMPPFAPSLITF